MLAIIHPSSALLKELLFSSDFVAKLFVDNGNSCEDVPGNLQLIEPVFDGYSSKNLNPNLWTLSTQSQNEYAQCTYSGSLIWKNTGANSSETIAGYYIADSDNNVLWFNKFEAPVQLATNQAVSVNINVLLNKTEGPKTTITIVVKNSDLTSSLIPDSSVSVLGSVKWGNTVYNNSIFDLLNNDFKAFNNIFCFGAREDITPCSENPLNFNISVAAPGFISTSKAVSIAKTGNTIINVNLDKAPNLTSDQVELGYLSFKSDHCCNCAGFKIMVDGTFSGRVDLRGCGSIEKQMLITHDMLSQSRSTPEGCVEIQVQLICDVYDAINNPEGTVFSGCYGDKDCHSSQTDLSVLDGKGNLLYSGSLGEAAKTIKIGRAHV